MPKKSLPVFVQKIFLLLGMWMLFISPSAAKAIELMGNKCEFTAEELINPDTVLELTLQGERWCNKLYVKQDLYGTVVLPHFGEWPRIHPEKAIPRLLSRYGVPKHEPFEPWGGVYREFRVLNKRDIDPMEGHAAIEYTVELLYVMLEGWQQVPKTGIYGIVPVCERNTLKIVAINFEDKWYIRSPMGMGDSLAYYIKATKNRNWERKNIPRDLAEYKNVEDRCKDHLN